MEELTGPRAGRRRGREQGTHLSRRAGAWLVWWVLLMSFWVILDDSIALDELLAGAGAAALAATLAELVGHQAATRFRMRAGWVVPALGLPGQVVRDTVIVFAALWRRLAHGEQPPADSARSPPASATTATKASPGGCCLSEAGPSPPTCSCSGSTGSATSWSSTSW